LGQIKLLFRGGKAIKGGLEEIWSWNGLVFECAHIKREMWEGCKDEGGGKLFNLRRKGTGKNAGTNALVGEGVGAIVGDKG